MAESDKPFELVIRQEVPGYPRVAEIAADSPVQLPPYPGGSEAYGRHCVDVVRKLRANKLLMERFSNWVRDEYNFNQEFATWLVFYATPRAASPT
jgi:hypothetical protein